MQDKRESLSPEASEPFFARFLEGQEASKSINQTLKYPSDRDEWDQRVEFTSAPTDR